MKQRRMHPVNFSTVTDAQIEHFRQYGVKEYEILAKRFLHLKNDWPSNRQFPHVFHNARTAEYLGLPAINFYWARNFENAVFNLRFGLENFNGNTIRCDSLVLSCTPTPVIERLPEAAWKYTVFFNGMELGRLGVNFHEGKDGQVTASIVNIQGKDGGPFAEYKKLNGRRMQWAFEALSGLVCELLQKVDVVMGISSLSHPSKDIPRAPGEKTFNPVSTFHLYDHNFAKSELGMVRTIDEAGRQIFERSK
ncbi:MAG: hypothetical protein WCT52_02930 [Candidatus Micrarchaeia archaeon]